MGLSRQINQKSKIGNRQWQDPSLPRMVPTSWDRALPFLNLTDVACDVLNSVVAMDLE
jgi:hypothetical protein